MHLRKALFVATAAAAALAGCQREGDIVVEQGVGITALRSVCPAVGVPDFTGDVTLFSPPDARTADALDKPVDPIPDDLMACLTRYRWPGNVRELANEIRRIVALAEDTRLAPELLSPRVRLAAADADQERELSLLAGLDGTLRERMDQLEARVLREALLRHRWNKTRAAQELGLSRVGLRAKLTRYGLDRD